MINCPYIHRFKSDVACNRDNFTDTGIPVNKFPTSMDMEAVQFGWIISVVTDQRAHWMIALTTVGASITATMDLTLLSNVIPKSRHQLLHTVSFEKHTLTLTVCRCRF